MISEAVFALCAADSSIERKQVGDFTFPLGVYPIEEMIPVPGYTVDFEPSDGDDETGEWEEWPDRYVYDVVISADRLQAFCRSILSLFPGRVFPILDVLGHDAYREIDPYIAYEPVGLDRVVDGIRACRDFLFEDGMCGFGALSEEPFLYMFVDEHKIVTIRVESVLRERVERLLTAFDLEARDRPAGADASSHEHRGVLAMPEDRPDLLGPDDLVERLRDEWHLALNVDYENNQDSEGRELGVTPWRCIIRGVDEAGTVRYARVLLTAGSLRRAEELAYEAVEAPEEDADPAGWMLVSADRLTPKKVHHLFGDAIDLPVSEEAILQRDWLMGPEAGETPS